MSEWYVGEAGSVCSEVERVGRERAREGMVSGRLNGRGEGRAEGIKKSISEVGHEIVFVTHKVKKAWGDSHNVVLVPSCKCLGLGVDAWNLGVIGIKHDI